MADMETQILSPESEQEFMNHLDNHFLFLLRLYNDPMTNLPEPKRELAKKWITKLTCTDTNQTVTAKARRNEYLTKLLSCINNGILCHPFDRAPRQGGLPKIDFGFSKVVEDSPTWLEELQNLEDRDVKVGGSNFETYLSAKNLDNGACAYIAMSVKNEAGEAAWMKIDPNKFKTDKIHEIFAEEFGDLIEEGGEHGYSPFEMDIRQREADAKEAEEKKMRELEAEWGKDNFGLPTVYEPKGVDYSYGSKPEEEEDDYSYGGDAAQYDYSYKSQAGPSWK